MNARGLLIRKLTSEDYIPVHALLEAAFEQPDEAKLVDQLRSERAIRLERVAETGGEVVGYCAFSPITCQPPLDGLLLGLGPLAVAPSHQRKGIGAALVEECLRICRENKARLIAVLGDPAYYARFGFKPAAERKMTWAGFDAGDAFRIIEQVDGPPIKTDKIRTVHYHPAFDAFS